LEFGGVGPWIFWGAPRQLPKDLDGKGTKEKTMANTQYSWETKQHIKLFAQSWAPEGEIKAVLALVHGIGEHTGRYESVAMFLNREGYALVGMDLRGHGKSGGQRGHFSFEDAMNDIDLLISQAQALFPGKPVFLYGHSLGGLLVLDYAMKRPASSLKGIIATSPALGTANPVPAWKLALANVMKTINPSMTMNNDLDVTAISHNPDVITSYKSDPLVHPLISARLGWDLLQTGPWLVEHAAEFPDIPLLLMQGNADRIVDPAATKKFAKKIKKGNITFQLWEGGYHEMHNEPNRDEVFNLLVHWLDRYCLPQAKTPE
jgi:alpha-beta hydrolase superfamily lysophospholipase